jgi:hypothetical protein
LLALLECRENKIVDQSSFIKTVANLEKFHFIFSRICQDRASGLEGKYTRAAKNLHLAGKNKAKAKQVLIDLTGYLKTKRPSAQRIEDSIRNLEYADDFDGHKKTLQLVFSKIEQHLQGSTELVVGEFSLEHIRDQSSKEAWTPSIGNLLPLNENLNNKIKTGSTFKQKKIIYKKSALKLVEHFLIQHPQDTWTVSNAKSWEKELAKQICAATELQDI